VVTVACTDAGRAQEVAARSGELAVALAREAGVAVTGLRVVIADHVQPPSSAPPRPVPPPEPGADARAAASGIAGSVEDAELRGYLERAAALSLDRRWREGPAGR
jgi:hypothetical protein